MKEYASPEEELSARQKRFIPINIITLALSLVASITLLFMPMLTVDLSVLAENMRMEDFTGEGEASGEVNNATVVTGGESSDEAGDGSEESDDESSSGSSQDEIMNYVKGMLDFKINIVPIDFAKAAMADDTLQNFALSIIPVHLIEKMGVNLMATILVNAVVSNESLEEIGDRNVQAIIDAVGKAESGNEAEAKQDLIAAVQAAAADLEIEWTEDMTAEVDSAFDEILKKGKPEGGNFSVEHLVVSMVSGYIGEEEEGTAPISTYEDLIGKLFAQFASELSGMENMISGICWGLFALMAFPAFTWALLALLSLLHIFMKNKTFLTWYVKWTGFGPCLLFGVLPLIAGKVFASSQPAMAGMIAALGTTTWISGGCFIALVLLSWFWLYPARRKIRRLRRTV